MRKQEDYLVWRPEGGFLSIVENVKHVERQLGYVYTIIFMGSSWIGSRDPWQGSIESWEAFINRIRSPTFFYLNIAGRDMEEKKDAGVNTIALIEPRYLKE